MSRYVPKTVEVSHNGETAFVPQTHLFTYSAIADHILDRSVEADNMGKDEIVKLLKKIPDECRNFVSEYTGWEGMLPEWPVTASERMVDEVKKLASLIDITLSDLY